MFRICLDPTRLRHFLPPLLLAACGVVLIGVIWHSVLGQIERERIEAIARAEQRNTNLAIAFDEYVTRMIRDADGASRYVAREYARLGARVDIRALMADRLVDPRLFSAVDIIDRNGVLISSSLEDGLPVAFGDLVRMHADGGDEVRIGKPQPVRPGGPTAIPVTRRLPAAGGGVGGVVALYIEPARFTGFYREASMQPGDVLALVGLDGIVRARRVGATERYGQDATGGALLQRQASQLSGTHAGRSVHDGVQRHYSYRTLAGYPLIALVGAADDEIYGALRPRHRRERQEATLATLLVILSGLGIAVVYLRQGRTLVRLEETQRFAQSTIDALSKHVAVIDREGVILRVNKSWRDYAGSEGVPADILEGDNLLKACDKMAGDGNPDAAAMAELLRGVAQGGRRGGNVEYSVRRGATARSFQVYVSRFEGPGPVRVVVAAQDISWRKQVENQLRESELRFKSMAANIPGMLFQLRWDDQGRAFTFVSERADEVCGMPAEQLAADSAAFFDLLHPESRYSFEETMACSRQALKEWNWEGRLRLAQRGGDKWINLRATPRAASPGTVIWDGAIFNITESKRHETSLLEARTALVELAAHQLSIKDEERKHIAREIHDELGQRLTVLRMDVLMLPRTVAADPAAMQAAVNDMRDGIDGILRIVRNIASDLRPAVLDIGVVEAIEWLVEEFRSSLGIACSFRNLAGEVTLDEERATGVFRILQESLTNAARHARASRIVVRLLRQGKALCLEVQDDGIGFEPAQPRRARSYGVAGMRERAAMLDGELGIFSGTGQGTRVRLVIPYAPQTMEK
ncbi:MAG TPA: histidine kinase [Noviherbaspirillum sp.]|jgi:PAS domain S-box-containing protein|uniref:histidine kinase n=1 Tax=Noviherbaspirillum sp. TaxID=1926288 RepID=UPI002F943622